MSGLELLGIVARWLPTAFLIDFLVFQAALRLRGRGRYPARDLGLRCDIPGDRRFGDLRSREEQR